MGFYIGQQDASRLCQVGSSASLFEQFDPKLFLEASDCVADRRLRAIELFRCRGEAAQLNNSLQDLPFIKGRLHYDQYI